MATDADSSHKGRQLKKEKKDKITFIYYYIQGTEYLGAKEATDFFLFTAMALRAVDSSVVVPECK